MYTAEYYSPFRRQEILQYVTAWMSLEDITLNETKLIQIAWLQ